MCMSIFACMYISVPNGCLVAMEAQKRMMDPLKWGLRAVVSHRVGATKQIWVLNTEPSL